MKGLRKGAIKSGGSWGAGDEWVQEGGMDRGWIGGGGVLNCINKTRADCASVVCSASFPYTILPLFDSSLSHPLQSPLIFC